LYFHDACCILWPITPTGTITFFELAPENFHPLANGVSQFAFTFNHCVLAFLALCIHQQNFAKKYYQLKPKGYKWYPWAWTWVYFSVLVENFFIRKGIKTILRYNRHFYDFLIYKYQASEFGHPLWPSFLGFLSAFLSVLLFKGTPMFYMYMQPLIILYDLLPDLYFSVKIDNLSQRLLKKNVIKRCYKKSTEAPGD